MSVCLSLSVFLYPMNVKTAEPIGPEFCVGPHVTQGKVYDWSKFQKFVFKSVFLFLQTFENVRKNIIKSANFLYCLFSTVQTTKRRCSQIKFKKKMGAKRPKSLVIFGSIAVNQKFELYSYLRNMKPMKRLKNKLNMAILSW